MKTTQLAAWIAKHGVSVVTVSCDSVSFKSEWSKPSTGETGFDVITVRTVAEAREALGY